MKIELLNKEYEEKVKFPDTQVEKTSEAVLDIHNPYDTIIGIECIPEDEDVRVKFCPEKLEGKANAKVILEYAPKSDRAKTLNGTKVRFKITL